VCGAKRWRFLPPRLAYLCRDVFGHTLAPDFLAPPADRRSREEAGAWTAQQQEERRANLCGSGALWPFPLLHAARYHEVCVVTGGRPTTVLYFTLVSYCAGCFNLVET
jgi:hypothetical protein